MTLDYIKNSKDFKDKIKRHFMNEGYIFSDRKIIVVTSHRRENFGDGIKNICKAISKIANEKEELDIVFPVHPNPNIKKLVYDSLNEFKNVFLVRPLSYEKFVYLMKKSYLILSDSGGVQEEAPSLGKPVLVMRDTTERIEAIEYGTVKLVGSLSEIIYSNTIKILEDKDLYNQISTTLNPYGDGDASKRILEIMKKMNKSVCVLGLGYIGLPTAAILADKGYHVNGVDIREDVVETINKGSVHIVEPGLEQLVKKVIKTNKLRASLSPTKLIFL